MQVGGGGCIPQINNPVGKEMMNNECAGVFNLVSYLRTVHGGSKWMLNPLENQYVSHSTITPRSISLQIPRRLANMETLVQTILDCIGTWRRECDRTGQDAVVLSWWGIRNSASLSKRNGRIRNAIWLCHGKAWILLLNAEEYHLWCGSILNFSKQQEREIAKQYMIGLYLLSKNCHNGDMKSELIIEIDSWVSQMYGCQSASN